MPDYALGCDDIHVDFDLLVYIPGTSASLFFYSIFVTFSFLSLGFKARQGRVGEPRGKWASDLGNTRAMSVTNRRKKK